MSNRVLRDGIKTSEAVNSLHDKTFRLYIFLLNGQDDFGLLEIGFGAIKGMAPLLSWTREEVAKMLGELTDHGLILPYEVDGKQFAALAKSQNYIRSVKPQHPLPTWGTTHCLRPSGFKDERTRTGSSKFFNHLPEENRVPPGAPRGTPRGPLGALQGTKEVGSRKWEVGKKEETQVVGLAPTPAADPPGFLKFWSAYPHYSGRSSRKECRALWASMKLEPVAERVLETVRLAKLTPDWKKDGGSYVKGAQRWLKLRLWDQESLGGMAGGISKLDQFIADETARERAKGVTQ